MQSLLQLAIVAYVDFFSRRSFKPPANVTGSRLVRTLYPGGGSSNHDGFELTIRVHPGEHYMLIRTESRLSTVLLSLTRNGQRKTPRYVCVI